MSKKKTLAHKKRLDERKQLPQTQTSEHVHTLHPQPPSYSFSSGKPFIQTPPQPVPSSQSLNIHVVADLRKTLILSLTVVLLELLLYLFLHHHILALPFIRY